MRMTIEAQRPIGHWGCLKRGYFRFEEERDDDIPAGRQHLLCRPLADRDADRACRGNFQMTKYGPIATPYCEEEQIAFVARSYGQSVTGAQVRKNPLMKVYLCQTLGYDSRLKGSCAGYGPDSYAPAR